MRKLLTAGVILGVTAMQLAALPSTAVGQSSEEPLAILVPGGGTYSRPITTTLILRSSFLIKDCAWHGVFTSPSRLPRIKKRAV